MDKRLKDQVALITGGTAGIGKAIAFRFGEAGAKVAILGTNLERGNQVVQELKSRFNAEAYFLQTNVAMTTEVDEAVKNILDRFHQVDILVNNAGITQDKLLMRMEENDWDNVMAINVKSCYNTCHALVRSMMKARKGAIINMSSVVGLTGNAGQANYAASKAAIIGFTKALAKELAPRNICVNCIAPGFIETPMTEGLSSEQKAASLAGIPLGRMGQAQDIAEAALYLACANYVTGQVLTVDGGMVM